MRKRVVGVMGGAAVDEQITMLAFELGRLIAEQGWVLLNGGRHTGVMAASARGARLAGGMVVGVLPDADDGNACPDLDVAILTGMGDARNVINVLSSHVVIACPGGAGTLSEVAVALKNDRPVIALGWQPGPEFEPYRGNGLLAYAGTPQEAVRLAGQFLL